MNFFKKAMKSFCEEALIEGAVTQTKAQIMDFLNHEITAKIVMQAKQAGFKVEADYVDDVDGTIEPAVVNVQLGYNSKTSESSQWITITVYDDNDIKVRLTKKIKSIVGEQNEYLAFESLNEVMTYLGKVYDFCK